MNSLLCLLNFTAGLFSAPGQAPPKPEPDFHKIIQMETDWIAAQQLPSGALRSHPSPGAKGQHLNPYFGNLACLALLERNAMQATRVRSYMEWYFRHLNLPDHQGLTGSIYDYDVDPGTGEETSTKDYDSVDSYAATFLMLARRYHETTRDSGFLKEHGQKLEQIAGLLMKLIDSKEHLAIAKPDYPVNYLMDNAEVAKGLMDADYVFRTILGDAARADLHRSRAEDVKRAIHTHLWGVDPKRNGWVAARQGMKNQAHSWSRFYPDSVCQLYPLWTGTYPPNDERVVTAYDNFNLAWPQWHTGTFGDSFPWAVMGYAAAVHGDRDRATAYLGWANTRYLSTGHPPPWTLLEAAFTTLAAAKLSEKRK